MTIAAGQYPVFGTQPLTNSTLIGVEVAQSVVGYVPLVPLGTITAFQDPFYGGLEAIRLAIPANTAVRFGSLSTLTNGFSFVPVPATANLGQSVAVCASDVPLNVGFVQYAWFIIAGRFPILCNVNIAADTAIGTSIAGQAGALAAGKQLLSARVTAPSTSTTVKAGSQLQNGSPNIRVSNTDGWFVGAALTGVGVPANAVIGAIDAPGTLVTMFTLNTVNPLNAIATIGTAVTATNSDGTRFWNTVTFQRPTVQGAIT